MATGIDCKLACSQPLQSGLGWAGLVIETKKGKESKGEGKKTKKKVSFRTFCTIATQGRFASTRSTRNCCCEKKRRRKFEGSENSQKLMMGIVIRTYYCMFLFSVCL